MLNFINANLPTIIILIGLFLCMIYLAVNQKWQELRSTAYKAMLIAEKAIIGTKMGRKRFEEVFQQVYSLVPLWLKLFVPQSVLREKLQEWYNHLKDYLYDGVFGGTSLESYFRCNNTMTDYSLIANISEDEVSFNIQPFNVNGDTINYIVKGNSLISK